ncbi:MAG: TolC family protein [Burkholderiales bacterium]
MVSASPGRIPRSIVRCCFIGLALATPLAQAADAPLTFAEAVRLAGIQSRQLAAQDAAVSAAREMSVSAGRLPDPVLRFGVDNLPVNGPDRFSTTADFMTMRRIGVMQEFTREEKRRLRGERGEQEAGRERANRLNMLANLQRDAAIAWLERYYVERMRAVFGVLAGETRASIEAAEAAYRGGRGTRSDVLGARATLVMVEDRGAMLERQLRAATIALARWIGPEAERPLQAPPPDLGTLSLDVARLDEELQHHPVLAALAQQVKLAQTEVRLAQTATKPDWSVELAYQQRGPAFSNMVSIGVSVPLPIAPAQRQDREVAAKLATAEQVRAQFDDALLAHTAEVRTMLADWETGRDRLRRIEAELVPLAAQRSDAALAAYRGNVGTLGAVLEARRNESDARMQALQLAAETARVWAQLNFLVPARELAGSAGGRTQ